MSDTRVLPVRVVAWNVEHHPIARIYRDANISFIAVCARVTPRSVANTQNTTTPDRFHQVTREKHLLCSMYSRSLPANHAKFPRRAHTTTIWLINRGTLCLLALVNGISHNENIAEDLNISATPKHPRPQYHHRKHLLFQLLDAASTSRKHFPTTQQQTTPPAVII